MKDMQKDSKTPSVFLFLLRDNCGRFRKGKNYEKVTEETKIQGIQVGVQVTMVCCGEKFGQLK